MNTQEVIDHNSGCSSLKEVVYIDMTDTHDLLKFEGTTNEKGFDVDENPCKKMT